MAGVLKFDEAIKPLRDRRPGGEIGQPRLGIEDLLDCAVDHGVDEVFLVREVVIELALAHVQRGRQIVNSLTKNGTKVRFIRADLENFDDVQRLARSS